MPQLQLKDEGMQIAMQCDILLDEAVNAKFLPDYARGILHGRLLRVFRSYQLQIS